ncbi:MAG TPA: hypothetical protein VGD63_11025 [Steroidobacteraceae bacterium]
MSHGMQAAAVAGLMMHSAGAQPATVPVPVLETTEIEVDVGALPKSERAALTWIIRAARQMDAVYLRQVWPDSIRQKKLRESASNPAAHAELTALEYFKGPWNSQGEAFIAEVPAKRPIGDFYPADSSKAELETWLNSLAEGERKRALDPFTAVRRTQGSPFELVRYSRYYAPELKLAANDLRMAANLTREPTLQRYLRARARALLDDNYYASDVAFVGLKGPIDVVLGPNEADDDSWFGVKTAFEASIAIVNEPATRRISGVTEHLQELEEHLPLAVTLRGRQLAGAAPVLVLDVVYHGGMAAARGGAAAGYGLPNDLRVQNAVGARTGTYRNILESRYQGTFRPIADAVLASSDQANLQFNDIVDEILLVRLFDSLGPQVVTGTTRSIADALQGNAAAAAQIRSMLLSLWGHRYLIEHGYRERREAGPMYAAFLIPALARIRGGLGSSSSQGSTYVLNHLIEAGAIHADATGRFAIDAARGDAEIERAAGEFISLMASGDAVAVEALLHRYVVISPEVQAALARAGAPPPARAFFYLTAEQLDPADGHK